MGALAGGLTSKSDTMVITEHGSDDPDEDYMKEFAHLSVSELCASTQALEEEVLGALMKDNSSLLADLALALREAQQHSDRRHLMQGHLARCKVERDNAKILASRLQEEIGVLKTELDSEKQANTEASAQLERSKFDVDLQLARVFGLEREISGLVNQLCQQQAVATQLRFEAAELAGANEVYQARARAAEDAARTLQGIQYDQRQNSELSNRLREQQTIAARLRLEAAQLAGRHEGGQARARTATHAATTLQEVQVPTAAEASCSREVAVMETPTTASSGHSGYLLNVALMEV